VENREKGKIKRVRGNYECEDEREKKLRERRENIIYTKNSGYLFWYI
jgi:hypothetical protein